MQKLISQKYYWLIFCHDIKTYTKKYNICLALKIVKYKLYNKLKFLLVFTRHLKDLLINFIISLSILKN